MQGKKRKDSLSLLKGLFVWLIIVFGVMLIADYFFSKERRVSEFPLSDIIKLVEQGNVSEVVISELEIKGKFISPVKVVQEGREEEVLEFVTFLPFEDSDFVKDLVRRGVKVQVKRKWDIWTIILPYIPFVFIIIFWLFLMRQMNVGPTKALDFGKSSAKRVDKDKVRVTFNDVAGVDEAVEELQEIVDFLKSPDRFRRLGGRIPRGVLLVGPPGTGKTLLARAVAGEADVPFFSISGSDFVELFVGVGASRVRDLFEKAKQNTPCIVFIDEIDAVGRHRGAGIGGGHDEREQTLNALLVEMDGFEPNTNIIVIAATNRPDVLDPALLRRGRFDRRVVVDLPDVRGREEILKVHTREVPLCSCVKLDILARGTPGFSGADLASLVNEAALLAARKGRDCVAMEDFEEAKDKVLMGVARKSLIISDEEKKTTAYHEAGHALVSCKIPGTDPIYKVTIIPRGRSLGATQLLPVDERRNYTLDYLKGQLVILLGGRAAELMVMNTVSTGAGNDLQKATTLARKMVCEWGMSEKLGPLSFETHAEQIFIGRELGKYREYSEKTAELIDEEVRRLIKEAESRAMSILGENIDALHRLAQTLVEREVLTGEELQRILEEDDDG